MESKFLRQSWKRIKDYKLEIAMLMLGAAAIAKTLDNSAPDVSPPQSSRVVEGWSRSYITTSSGFRFSLVYTEGSNPVDCGDGRVVNTSLKATSYSIVMDNRESLLPYSERSPQTSIALTRTSACRNR